MGFGDIKHVYAIRHNPTNKLYIGCSGNGNRVQSHLTALKSNRHINKAMQDDCNKYGFDYSAFLIEVINDRPLKDNAHEREQYWIHYYHTNNPVYGYNTPKWYKTKDISSFPEIPNAEWMWSILRKRYYEEKQR